MGRQKSSVPLRHFSLSVPWPLYDFYDEWKQESATLGVSTTITELIIDAMIHAKIQREREKAWDHQEIV